MDYAKGVLETGIESLENEMEDIQGIREETEKRVEEIDSKKEQMKEHVKQHFKEIREALNRREKEILDAINGTDFGGDQLSNFIGDAQKTIADLSSTIEPGKALLDEWDNTKDPLVNVCKAISIGNRAKEIQTTGNTSRDVLRFETVMDSTLFEEDAEEIAQSINTLQDIKIKRVSTARPKNFAVKSIGPFTAMLGWERDEDDFEYIVSTRKGTDSSSTITTSEWNENRATISTLEPETGYEFSVVAKRRLASITTMSEASDVLTVKTTPFTVDNLIIALNEQCVDSSACARNLEGMKVLARDGIYIHAHTF